MIKCLEGTYSFRLLVEKMSKIDRQETNKFYRFVSNIKRACFSVY